jgi:spore coat polysaccharide biosynthesis protein SpsF (cytidylyltransferase family)
VILALVQARMASTRLPNKVMLPLNGRPMIEHIVHRVSRATLVDKVCVCTSDQPEDDVLAAHVESLGVDVYRGSMDDVLARFYWASQRYPDADAIIRITGEDPFKDPALIDYAIEAFLTLWAERPTEKPIHYVHLGGPTWPLGMDVEVFTPKALRWAYEDATRPYDREHVTSWFTEAVIKRDDRFGMAVLRDQHHRAGAGLRWTVDTATDASFAAIVYDRLGDVFGYDDMLAADVESLRRYPVGAT